MNGKKQRKINLFFEGKKYPLFINDSDKEETFYRDARLNLLEQVNVYRTNFSKVNGLSTSDFYIMSALQFALDSLFNDMLVDKLSQLTDEIDQYLKNK